MLQIKRHHTVETVVWYHRTYGILLHVYLLNQTVQNAASANIVFSQYDAYTCSFTNSLETERL